MYKRILVGIGIAGILVFSASLVASPVAALTVDELQAQIKELLAKVGELTRQLNTLQGSAGIGITSQVISDAFTPSPDRHRICSVLYRNLGQGTSGDDVKGLQEFLREEGRFSADAT